MKSSELLNIWATNSWCNFIGSPTSIKDQTCVVITHSTFNIIHTEISTTNACAYCSVALCYQLYWYYVTSDIIIMTDAMCHCSW